MMLRDLLNDVPTPWRLHGEASVDVTSLSADSRAVAPGALFFALPGTKSDGRAYLGEAVARGAAAVACAAAPAPLPPVPCVEAPDVRRAMSAVAARFHGRPSRRLALVGITGTNGKTTTSYLLESIWQAAGLRPGVVGTILYRAAGRTWPAPFTTPDAIELQALLAEMADAGATHVAMEVSSHALALGRADDCDFDAAVFTNLTRDHLDFHPDMEAYFAAKRRLFTELLPASSKPERFAVVNLDDPSGRRLAEAIPDRVVTYGRTPEADVEPIDVERSLDGLRGEIRVGAERFPAVSSLVGEAHLDNLLCATATAHGQGIPLAAISAGIERCPAIPGRMQRVDAGAPFAVLVDYAHTPDALERAVRVLRSLAENRLVVLFGCGGDRDRGKRPLMGEAAARVADVLILTSDNPRSEDPLRILHDIERGVREAGLESTTESAIRREDASGYLVVPDRRAAIRLAVSLGRPGDVVLIAGKGHESYQIVGSEKRPFDDAEEARRALAGTGAA